jgi:hypothetical protein
VFLVEATRVERRLGVATVGELLALSARFGF